MRRQDAGGAESPSSCSGCADHADILSMVPHLRAYARSLTAGKVDLADDLVQDTLVLALGAWQSFTPGTNLKGWLFQILHNRYCSVISRKHVRAEVGVDDLSWLASVPAFQERRPEVREFKLAFARLTPAHREVLVLHAVHGMPYEQVAEICGCEVGTVKSRINRARNFLKQMLLGEGGPKQSLHAPPLQARTPCKQPSPPPRCGMKPLASSAPPDGAQACPGRSSAITAG
jgi:RNA polymerase sigma-70 factor (ECF subfamily)